MSLLHAASTSGDDKLYVDDVFSTYLYTGNGSTQTINNGVDLAGEGGLVWIKSRSHATDNVFLDTIRGGSSYLSSNTANAANTTQSHISSFGSSGFTLTSGTFATTNSAARTYASWTFRKAPKFFDVVTYTGNGVAGRQIAHSLGQEVGMVIIKRTDSTGDWYTFHKSMRSDSPSPYGHIRLNWSNPVQDFTGLFVNISNSSYITLAVDYGVTIINASGASYVAYLFAHDPSPDGIIQAGSFTTDASGNATVNLGWEPQYLLMKKSSGVDQWYTVDVSRGWSQTNWNFISPNNSFAEYGNATATGLSPNAVGFTTNNTITSTSSTYIYLAIRRPNKPPTSGSEVYNAAYSTASATIPTFNAGFAVDMALRHNPSGTNNHFVSSRLLQGRYLVSNSTDTEVTQNDNTFASNSGWGTSYATSFFSHMFRRAPGFFDIVAYTGTGVARTVNHNLGVAPELMIVKRRDASVDSDWAVYFGDHAKTMLLNSTSVQSSSGSPAATGDWGTTTPTATQFSVGNYGTNVSVNGSGHTFVSYLFASLPGISKVGSYTGNGTSQTINCGFSSGARFVLSKAVSTTGNWNVGDSTRGITAGSDPYLCLNTTSAEVITDDWLDNESSGFIVNETSGTRANTNGVQYIFLAVS